MTRLVNIFVVSVLNPLLVVAPSVIETVVVDMVVASVLVVLVLKTSATSFYTCDRRCDFGC